MLLKSGSTIKLGLVSLLKFQSPAQCVNYATNTQSYVTVSVDVLRIFVAKKLNGLHC